MIKNGTTVTWINNDYIDHTIAMKNLINLSIDNQTNSKLIELDPFGGSHSITFNKEGNFSYYCTIHPHTTAVIRVDSK